MRRQGRIVEWNDARGCGVVQWHGGDERAFAHLGAFDRGARPCVGDVVTYAVVDGDLGPTAMAIRYPGASPAIRRAAAPRSRWTLHRAMRALATSVAFVVLATAGWRQYAAHQAAQLPALAWAPLASGGPTTMSAARPAVSACTGRQRCTQEHSCADAALQATHCPGAHVDGNRDDAACEDTCR